MVHSFNISIYKLNKITFCMGMFNNPMCVSGYRWYPHPLKNVLLVVRYNARQSWHFRRKFNEAGTELATILW